MSDFVTPAGRTGTSLSARWWSRFDSFGDAFRGESRALKAFPALSALKTSSYRTPGESPATGRDR